MPVTLRKAIAHTRTVTAHMTHRKASRVQSLLKRRPRSCRSPYVHHNPRSLVVPTARAASNWYRRRRVITGRRPVIYREPPGNYLEAPSNYREAPSNYWEAPSNSWGAPGNFQQPLGQLPGAAADRLLEPVPPIANGVRETSTCAEKHNGTASRVRYHES